MAELWLILLPPIGWLFWTLGGWDWVIGEGQQFRYGKVFRRILLPAAISLAHWVAGMSGWRCFGAGVLMSTVIWIAGYGEDSKLRKWLGIPGAWILYGCALSLTTLPYRHSLWNIWIMAAFPILTALSQSRAELRWKLVEGFTGLLLVLGCI